MTSHLMKDGFDRALMFNSQYAFNFAILYFGDLFAFGNVFGTAF